MSRTKAQAHAPVPAAEKPKREDLPRRIAELRKKFQLDQRGLADVLAVSQSAVAKWELGTYEPSAEYLLRLAALAYEEDAIFFYKMAKVDLRRISANIEGPTSPKQPDLSINAAGQMLQKTPDAVVKLVDAGTIVGRRVCPDGAPVIDYSSLVSYMIGLSR